MAMKTVYFFLITAVLFVVPTVAPAAIRYIKPVASGTGDGTSWANASGDLQAMIDTLKINYHDPDVVNEIWLANGTYKPVYNPGGTGDPRDKSFYMKDQQIWFRGGFNGTETSPDQRVPGLTTKLSGDIGTPNDQTDNCFHVCIFFSSGYIVFDQIQVEGGYANGGGNIEYQGIFIPRNLGGGLYLHHGDILYRTTIILNKAAFVGNSASQGSAIYEARVGASFSPTATLWANQAENTIFLNNTADQGGATWYNPTTQWYQIHLCTFANNSGGSFYFGDLVATNSVEIWNNVFSSKNSSTPEIVVGPTPYSLNIQNCIFRKGAGFPGNGNVETGDFQFRNQLDPFGQDFILGTADDGLQHHPDFEGVNIGYPFSVSLPFTDIAGNTRTTQHCDAGAYERDFVPFRRWYVKPDGTGNGSSWADASGDLQHIINSASGRANDEIWVAKGIYKPNQSPILNDNNNRNFTFLLRSGVKMYGGFSGTESSESQRVPGDRSTCSGDIGALGNKSDNCYHVVVSLDDSPNTLFDGFRIENGIANGSESFPISGFLVNSSEGAGIYAAASNLQLRNSVITGCEALNGAGIYFQQANLASVSYVDFLFNLSLHDGGAIYNFGSNVSVTHCLFNANQAVNNGGAIYCATGGVFNFNNLIFNQNEAETGGALFNNRSSVKIRNSVFLENVASNGGGGINTINNATHFLDVSYCTFYANSGGTNATKGDAIMNSNSFFGGNPAKVSNSIFWGSTAQLQNADGTNMAGVQYCTVQGPSNYPGTNNLNTDPSFVSAPNAVGPDLKFGTDDDGLRISVTSPARNSSHPDSTQPNVDISALCRNGVYDQGAYQSFTTHLSFFGNNRPIDGPNVVPGLINHTDFGVGSGITRVFKVKNNGLNPVSIGTIYASTLDSAKFQVSGVALPFDLAPGDSNNFSVTFTSSLPGAFSTLIRVVPADCGQPTFSFNVMGTVLPSIGDFANQTIQTGAFKLVTPAAPISQNTGIAVSTRPTFKGLFLADPNTGSIKVINPNLAGTYPVSVKINAGMVTVTKTFILTVTKSSCSSGAFVNNAYYPEGLQSSESVPGDFNGDGWQDLATGLFSLDEGRVSVRLGVGNGGFGNALQFNVANGIKTLVTADFNRDGILDIATAGASNFVSVRLGDGVGHFSGNVEIPTFNAQRMAVGDFNQDGNPDLVVTNGNQNRVQILSGDGTGNFVETGFASVGLLPNDVAVSDFNNDGNADLSISLGFGSGTTILLGNGSGQFPTRTDISNTAESNSVSVADINNDGKVDWVNTNFMTNSLTVHLGNGLGGSFNNFIIPLSGSAYYATIGDFNGDGFADLASLSFVDNHIEILAGDGTGHFSSSQPLFPVPFNSARLLTGDFNGDGVTDLANASTGNTVFLGKKSRISVFGNFRSIENGDDTPATSDNTDFGSVVVGQSLSKIFRIKNSGTGSLQLDQIQIIEPQGFVGTFLLTSPGLPATIQVADSIDITIQFQPTGLPGNRSATIEIKQLACNQIFTFQIGGNAANAGPLSVPVISVSTGSYPNPLQVSISSPDPNAEIWYTTNGNLPRFDIANGFTKKYTGPFQVNQTTTIRAVATKPGQANSPVAVSFITITNPGICSVPVISPVSGSYEGSVSVNISTATSEAEIWYTTNGNLPRIDIPNSFTKRYQGPFTITQNISVRAMAVKTGLTNSGVSMANYVITNPIVVDQPIFGLSPGPYPGPQVLSISSSTSGAQIFYTTNGNEPRFDVPNSFTKLYSTPILVNQTMTIRAVAVLPNNIRSKTTVGTFTIGSSFRIATEKQNPVLDKFSLSIFPNPSANGIFNMDATDLVSEVEFELTSLDGRVLKMGKLNHENKTLDLTRYNSGIYILRVYQGRVLSTFRLIKL